LNLGPENRELAVDMFQMAVDLDPDYVEAHAALARSHCAMYHFSDDDTPERQEMARQAAERAVELAPDAPEAHAALGWYHYQCLKEYEPALREFGIALEGRPDDSELLSGIVFIRRRQGRFEEALQSMQKAAELDPLDAGKKFDVGLILWMMRRYEEADAVMERAVAQAPDVVGGYALRYFVNLSWHGSLHRARAILGQIPESMRTHPWSAAAWSGAEYNEGNYEAALEHLAPVPDDMFFLGGIIGLQRAQIYDAAGDEEKAHAAYEYVRGFYKKKIEVNPADYSSHSGLGVALAGLGRKEEAIRAGRRSVELCPVSRDALDGPGMLVELARIYTMTGEADAALDTVEEVLALPATGFNLNLFRIDRSFDTLRDHPRYLELEERFG
jgi:tetratricopeptide (TPR) repeat protein